MQIWIITNRGYFISAYSSRDKAFAALAALKDRGILRGDPQVRPWTLDSDVN